ncbi:MAG: hypothetical protein EZS28_045054, partial [Streblomastix strix]
MFMAFNKLAFVLVFAILSSGEEDLDQGTFAYSSNEIDSNGYLQIKGSKKGSDADATDTSLNIRDFKAFVNGTKYTDDSFYTVSKTDFPNLPAVTGAATIGCSIIAGDYTYQFVHLGLAAKFYAKENIAPSFTWLLANAPTRRVYKDKPAGADSSWNDLELEYTCYRNEPDYDFVSPTIHKYGVVDAQCFPNDEVPTSLTTCTGTSTV